MTFEIPESRAIDIEALKQNIQAYVNLVVAYPTILKKGQTGAQDLTVETVAMIEQSRREYKEGKVFSFNSSADAQKWLESL
ncbi:MAG: hypothetical protein KBT20_03210 [Bacteroidales bacterium]|nr:hypothetical protein [Candidatus Liminaster caballi]